MRNKIENFIRIPLLLLLSSMLFVQCDKSDTVVATESLDDMLAKSTDLSMFKSAVAKARLETFTKGPGPFTIFAPTDAAFTAAGITSATIAAMDSITLTALVLNHFQTSGLGVLKGRTSFEIPEGPNAPMASIAGYSNYSYKDKAADKIYVSGALVTERDIKCSNGIIHKINKVLFPPVLPVMTLLAANPNYSLMVQAINKTGLQSSTFAPAASSPITVFALSNAVMTANGYDATTIAALVAATPAYITLSNILKYNVAASRNFSTDMKAGALRTAYVIGASTNTFVTVSFGPGLMIKGVSNTTPFLVTGLDIAASNGVIQEIAGMLKP